MVADSNIDISDFLVGVDLNLRIEKPVYTRWIDQKCTADVVGLVASAVVELSSEQSETKFTKNDVWKSEYSRVTVTKKFSKPDTGERTAENEYDKFFAQPLELLAFSGVLSKWNSAGQNYYKVENMGVLRYIASDSDRALEFLTRYIEHVLVSSGFWPNIEAFFADQTPEGYLELKERFIDFLLSTTRIKKRHPEPGRIFSKVLNPLSFEYSKCGTIRGRISRHPITYDDLWYNRPNWRDTLANKRKSETRQQYDSSRAKYLTDYKVLSQKAKNYVKGNNNEYRGGKSEVPGDDAQAHHIHHIFPESQFKEIAMRLENLIALTPNQHYLQAHAKSTIYVDREFQKACIFAKIDTIEEEFAARGEESSIYSFSGLVDVLEVGFFPNLELRHIGNGDFDTLRKNLIAFFG